MKQITFCGKQNILCIMSFKCSEFLGVFFTCVHVCKHRSLKKVKAHVLPFNVRFQCRPPHFAHTFATWKRQTHHFSLEVQEDQRPKYNTIIVTNHELSFGFIRRQHRIFHYSWFVILSCKHYV